MLRQRHTCMLYIAAVLVLGLRLYGQTKQPEEPRSLTLNGTTLIVAEPGANKPLNLRVNTLTLQNGAKIITNGNPLRIKAVMIKSSGGKIISFPETTRTPKDAPTGDPGTAGLDGGTVEIDATDLDGRLTVELPGQNGGKGGQGEAGAPGKAGTHGTDASDHLFDCARAGGAGGAGGNGEDGHQGANGGAAGKGGTLTLKGGIKSRKNLIDFSAPPGKPGEKGPGGEGGQGGAGGQGGSGSVHCGGGPSGAPGLAGKKGPDGQPGAQAEHGKVETP
jgi:hypothetical protein